MQQLAATCENRIPGFAISHQPEPAAGWLELLATGLTFDLIGMAPVTPAPLPEIAHFYGFSKRPDTAAAEAITLMPGEPWRGLDNALPVIRALTGAAIRLAGLADVTAVVWHPARCAMAPAAFATVGAGWLQGGAFPALGLTALFRDSDGAICSEGLKFFIGHELRIDPNLGKNTAEDAKIATRLINLLVGTDSIHQPGELLGPNGECFSVEPPGDDGFSRVWRSS